MASDKTEGAGLVGEHAAHKVSATFATAERAREAANRLRQGLGLTDAQVQVITPGDPRPGRKMQPEGQGIFRTMMVAHAKLGIAGGVVGAIAWWVMRAMGVAIVANTGLLTLVVLVGFGITLGLMLGGLVTLRPDHDPYILSVKDALDEGRSAVVVHAFDAEQRDAAQALLDEISAEVLSSL